MTIKTGDRFPDVTLKRLGASGMEEFQTGPALAAKRSVVVGIPAAFSPTCSDRHIPGYLNQFEALKSKGVDQIFVVAVNDPFVMNAWAKALGNDGRLSFLPDGNGALANATGLTMDVSGYGMGQRNRRYAMLVEDGVVKSLSIDEPGKLEVTTAEAMLKAL